MNLRQLEPCLLSCFETNRQRAAAAQLISFRGLSRQQGGTLGTR